MKTADRHLNDEHMQMYEWSGLGAGLPDAPAAGAAKRTHAWHASYGVLAALTTLLILNGCDAQTATEQASEQVGQAARSDTVDPQAQPMDGGAAEAPIAPPGAIDAAPPAVDGTTPQPDASSGQP
ncbi:MAG TPA: hypothetical protein PKC12_07145 [Thiobacillaceae bacterium]|nr:hypothetical protein [Thiobacillaceae bacterium]